MHHPNNTLPLPPPPEFPTTEDPLKNLSTIQTRLDSLSHTLSHSVNANTPLPRNESDTISAELSAAIHHVIINGAALIASSYTPKKSDGAEEQDLEIIELDEEDLTADHTHVCEFCGKGFKRDANLRMHMRAHGDKYKTLESLSKPHTTTTTTNHHHQSGRKTRFSCPSVGCDRNKKHHRFRPLKSAVCVKNHFKRFHCPKVFWCTMCKSKSFSMVGDWKNHMKHCCGEETSVSKREFCSCGLRFLSKKELFQHVSLSDGHMPVAGGGGGSEGEGEEEGVGMMEEDQGGLDDMSLWSSIEEIVQYL